eukprot:s3156_g13.t1
MLENPQVTQALKEAVAELAGESVEPAMVNLIVGCLAAGRRLGRLLAEVVGVCFEVEGEDAARRNFGVALSSHESYAPVSETVCETLSSQSTATVRQVVSTQLLEAGIDPDQVNVVGYQADPNPQSYDPTLNVGGSPSFTPGDAGVFKMKTQPQFPTNYGWFTRHMDTTLAKGRSHL